jgi:ABC-2 type transport system ATP-binding protein
VTAPLIQVDDVVVSYGSHVAVDHVTVDIDSAATGLLGANGAGKSTLMKAILGLLTPASGNIRILGHDTAHAGDLVRRRVGYMPEHDCLPLTMTAADMVVHLAQLRGLPHRDAVRRASEVLFTVGLEEERSRLIEGYSQGMKQRAKLAQSIVHGPEVVFLDEPTTGLDPAGRAEMLALVRRISSDLGIHVVVSSHILDDIRRTCDSVVVLREGKLAAAETLESFAPTSSQGMLAEVGTSAKADLLATALGTRGFRVTRDGEHGIVITDGSDAAMDMLRDTAADAGIALRRLVPAGGSVEDALVTAMTE